MKFREILRFELAYQLRRVSTWLFVVVLAAFAFLLIRGFYVSNARRGGYFVDAPAVIGEVTVLCGLIWLLMAGAVAGDAAARDVETRMHPFMYTAPVRKTDYLGGRFLAVLVLNALTLLAVPAGILLAMFSPGVDTELLGPFRPAAYLSAYFFIALPNGFVVTAIQFSWAALSRRGISSYLASGFLFFASHFGLGVVGLIAGRDLTRLLDFVGIQSIVGGWLDTWTPIEKNTRLIELEGWLLANRLVWLGIALSTLTFTYFRFRFGHHTASGWWNRSRRRREAHSPASADAGIARSAPICIPQVRRTFSFATYARQTIAIAWDSFGRIAKSRGGLTLVAVSVIPTAFFASMFMRFQGVPLFPRTEEVIRSLTPPLTDLRTPWVIIPLLIVYYAGELIWREREAGVSEMVDAAPVPEWALFLGKFLGVGMVLVVWLAFVMATGMLMQVLVAGGGRGAHVKPDFEVGLYLQALFWLQFVNYLLFALLALAVHVLVNQKYVGHLVALIALGFIGFASRLGIARMFVYGSDPGWTYTDMRGFEPFLAPWLWFKLYWAAWALLLAVATSLLWARGRERSLRLRLELARQRFTRRMAGAAAAAVALILTVGGFIFYNTNVLNAYRSVPETTHRRVEYERRYGRYAGIPQPRLTATNLHVEIYPSRRKADIRGTYRLQNNSAVPIESIHLATAADVETTGVAFDRAAATVVADDELRYRIYALEKPLQPGDSLQLTFEVHFAPHGFSSDGVDASVVANGTYFTNLSWLPAIGYQPVRELSNAGDRRARGLAHRPVFKSLDDVEARGVIRADTGRTAFEAVVGTDEDQIAVAPGTLRRSWTEGGRRYFHYVADAPIKSEYAFFSAAYAVHEAQWNPSTTGSGHAVAIRILHQPGHAENVERMVRSIRASLDYNSTHLGPYPHRSFTAVEHPGHGRGMHADSGTITYEEGFSLINPGDGPQAFDLPFFVVAHEAAHQWWGTQLLPAPNVEGSAILVETIANYSALRVVEETYGREHMRRVLDMWRAQYEIPRTRAAVPLLRATEPFLFYRKGGLVMHALSEYIGAERVNDALRRVFEKYGSGALPLPTALDLYRELQAVTPDQFRSLLHDLFEANAYWELETERATAEQTAAGAWQVTLDVRARKVMVDEGGVETEVPMDDWVQVGVFAPADKAEESDNPLYLQVQRIRSGQQMITVTVPRKPTRAGIDPSDLLIDLKTDDNIKLVKIER